MIWTKNEVSGLRVGETSSPFNGEFDPGSELTLAECITHASRAGVADYRALAADE